MQLWWSKYSTAVKFVALFSSGYFAASASWADAMALAVNPHLCITDSPEKTCTMALEFFWQSNTEGNYCLAQKENQEVLQCWQQDKKGQWQAQKIVQDQEIFWMTNKGEQIPLAAVVIEVLTTFSEDRRRNRPRRHVWSIM